MRRPASRRAPGSPGSNGQPAALAALACVATLLAVPIAGCVQVRVPTRPLDPPRLLATVRAERQVQSTPEGLGFAEATRLMRQNNPEIRDARAAYRSAKRAAAVSTPPPNPTLDLGPLLLGGADVLTAGRVGVELALGWTVLLSRKNLLEDDVGTVKAEAAFAKAAAVEREQYLALRAAYLQSGLAQDRVEAERLLAAAAGSSVDAAKGMVETGQASSVDLRLLQLDAARAHADVVADEEASEERRQALAALIAVVPEAIVPPRGDRRPPLPGTPPRLDELELAAVAGHPHLSVLRAEYVVAEKVLRLESARAIPDLGMGLSFEREGDDRTVGLPFGIELPIFDRNQVALTEACAARDELRNRYRAELGRLLSRIATARARVGSRIRRVETLESTVEPEAARALAATREALGVGTADALRYLEVVRTSREITLQVLDARAALFEAWCDLESACGVPLLRFPEEPAGPWPSPLIAPPPPPLPDPVPVEEAD